jgi:glycosyltransferase involved in cell wall biosynthesis
MRILFLSHYFPPEVNAPATRTYEHCKQWVKMGHDVTVVSCVPHHPMGKIYPGYKNKLVQVEYKDGIKAIKVLTYIAANQGFFKRTCNYLFYMVMTILIAPFLSKMDVVISTSPQFFNGLAGFFVSRIKRVPWLLEIRDLWPESILALGAIKNRRVIQLLKAIERFIYCKADHIVPVTNAFKAHILRCGASDERITVIHNGVDLSFFDNALSKNIDYAHRLGVGNKFVAIYVGTHGMAHGLDTILSAAELLKTRNDIVFLMVGDGSERHRLETEITRRQLSNIKMLGQLPKSEMPRLWSISDVSLVLLRKLDLFLTVIPSKIFESMAMKKPIVLGVEGESQKIITAAGAGLVITPEDAEQLADRVVKLSNSPKLCRKLGECGYQYVSKHFDRNLLAMRFEAELAKLCRIKP